MSARAPKIPPTELGDAANPLIAFVEGMAADEAARMDLAGEADELYGDDVALERRDLERGVHPAQRR